MTLYCSLLTVVVFIFTLFSTDDRVESVQLITYIPCVPQKITPGYCTHEQKFAFIKNNFQQLNENFLLKRFSSCEHSIKFAI